MEQHNWNNTSELFEQLNKQCNYLILRNYECMDQQDIFTDGHEDIDFLCEDQQQMVSLLDARPRHRYDNKVQYVILIGGKFVKIDLRHTGDAYYDPLWEQRMLKNRVLHPFGFYVMNREDYFYSLIYHSILQKKFLSEDYRLRLEHMASEHGLSGVTERDFLRLLDRFMLQNGYYYFYPNDCTVTNRFHLTDPAKRNGYFLWCLRKVRHLPIRTINYMINKSGG